jgi:hypothetical protein
LKAKHPPSVAPTAIQSILLQFLPSVTAGRSTTRLSAGDNRVHFPVSLSLSLRAQRGNPVHTIVIPPLSPFGFPDYSESWIAFTRLSMGGSTPTCLQRHLTTYLIFPILTPGGLEFPITVILVSGNKH